MKIATVLGTRPQFIKAAVGSRAFSFSPDVEEVIVHTGQHYDDNMSEVSSRNSTSQDPPTIWALDQVSMGVRSAGCLRR